MERRLAAILAADVVGYSRLMGEDEIGTHAAFKAHREELIDPKVTDYHGHIVKLTGDGALVEFASVVNAVEYAVDIQRAMAERNSDVPQERRIILRIGINLGDVIVEEDDIYGDGVNVAARLEGLADPGGICISGKVYEEVRNKLSITFEDLGEREVKNIPEPVRVYRWTDAAPDPMPSALGAEGALPPPYNPSIAVLPFTNMSGDPEQEYFADGITEDIITELSRFRSLFVIARTSSFHYKGASPKVQDVRRELGVQYVVEGSVRKAANRVRITAQLVETESGNHLWAERYDRELEDIFAVQDEVTRTVVSTVAGRIDAVGHQRANRMSPDSLKAYDLILRANSLVYRFTRADNAKARELLAQAIALDPVNAHAHAELSAVYLMDWAGHWVEDGDAALSEALRWGKQAVALDDADSSSHCCLGEAYHFNREFDKARFHLEKAINLNPNDVEARGVYGQFLSCAGESNKALAEFEYARQIDPHDLVWLPWIRGFAYFNARQYDAAIACFEQIEDPYNEVCALLAASYAHVGRLDEAKSMLEEFLRRAEEEMVVYPGRSLAAWKRSWRSFMLYKDKADVEMWLDGLHKAGLED